MPRKQKLLAHLARQNEKRARTAPSSSVINVVGGHERPDQSGSGDPESDSELPYWPAEEDAESISMLIARKTANICQLKTWSEQ